MLKSVIKNLLPRHLGGRDFNLWNHLIARLTCGDNGYYVDRNLRVHLHPRSRQPLLDWIKSHHVASILEVGLGTGENAKMMIELAGRNCTYFCFDNLSLKDGREAFEELRVLPNAHFFIGDTMETIPLVIDCLPPIDLIFIDGCHEDPWPKSDWENVRQRMHEASVCFFHDYDEEGVKVAVDGIDEGYFVEIIRTDLDTELWARVRLKGDAGDEKI